MTRTNINKTASWSLQEAKARFSDLVHAARSAGPQHVMLDDRAAVIVISQKDYRHLKGERTGQLLVDLLAASPLKHVEMEHEPIPGAVRDLEL